MIERVPPEIMRLQELNPNPYVELITMAIVISVSFYIFFKTHEIYNLTKHRGINYFRKAFLFFGLAGFSAIVLQILRPFTYLIPYFRGGFFIVTTFMLIAVLYAFFSLFSKEFKKERYIYYIAAIVDIVVLFVNLKIIVMLFLSGLFITIGIISYIKYHKKKKSHKSFSNMYLIYMALFGFWLLNAIRVQLAIYFDITGSAISVFSALIFLYILHIFRRRFSMQ